MRRFASIFSLLLTLCLQAQVTENFTDGDFTDNPIWIGTEDLFTIEDGQLKLFYDTETISSTQAFLSTRSEVDIEATWQMQATINTTTSSANYVRFYLTADTSDLSAPLNGYFVMIGNTNDEVCLYKQAGNTKTKIIDGTDKRIDLSQFSIAIKVTRDSIGNWQLFSKIADEPDFVSEGTCFDNDILGSRYAGVFIAYSKTNVGKYLFDNFDIEGEKFTDKTPPSVLDHEITAANKLQITFSEEVQTENFHIETNSNTLQTFTTLASNIAELAFAENLVKGELHAITLCGVCDKSGNRLSDSLLNVYVAARKDIVFNEILADPEPQVALPNAKFIELYNRSRHNIRLKNWLINIGKSTYKLTDITLPSNDYLIVCATNDTSKFCQFGTCSHVSSLSAMTIAGTTLSLYATTEECIDWVEYSNEWYSSEFKKDGGWSLERIDAENFNCIGNWKTSNDKRGGTPAQRNSVAKAHPDTMLTAIDYFSIDAPDTIRIQFSKEMNEASCLNPNNYSFNFNDAKHLQLKQPENRILTVVLTENLSETERDTLTVSNLYDISNRPLSTQMLPVTLPQLPENYQDVIINEVLFNPKDDGVDYVEIFNSSDKVLNLADIFVTTRKEGDLQKCIAITSYNEPLSIGSYLVLTTDPEKVKEQYTTPPDAFFKKINLPNLPAKEGNIVLTDKEGFVFDEFAYTEKMHHTFIKATEGVALERINPNLPTQDAETWQSAASTIGYGTPCQKNSQYIDLSEQSAEKTLFYLQNKGFSPDNDGYQDLLQINYQLPENGYIASINIFTANGLLVRKLHNNIVLNTEGTLLWDGTNDSNSLCNVGVYIIYIEMLHPSGKRGHEKLVCSLTSR